MRNLIIIALVLAAVGIYAWDALLLVHPSGGEKKELEKAPSSEPLSLEKLLAHADPAKFIEKGRNPFIPSKIVPKPAATSEPQKSNSPVKPDVTAPKIVITGIMWNPKSPIVMLNLPDGSSTVASPKQVISGITIKKIEQTRILVSFNNKDYWIAQ